MPTTLRLLFCCIVLIALVYGAMVALATYVEPVPRTITVRIPPEKLAQ
jgi:hypothetical protein